MFLQTTDRLALLTIPLLIATPCYRETIFIGEFLRAL